MMATKTKRGLVITRKEAATRLTCSTRTVDRLIAAGDLSAKKGGHKVYVHEWSVDAYLESLPAARGVR
jgi:excisionase family DNA binding protein